MCRHSSNTFVTSSQDKTLRLWDIRAQSSIKLIRNKVLTDELTNPASDGQNCIYVGSDKNVYEFDLRQSEIFIENFTRSSDEPHYDTLSHITFNPNSGHLLCSDDEGDIRVYSTEQNGKYLQCAFRLEQQHVNICNSVEFLVSQNKNLKDKQICISGGFDSTLILWDIEKQEPLKKLQVLDILHKFGITTNLEEHPFVHSISQWNSSVLVGIQSGYVLCLPITELKKPKFIMQCSLTRVTHCKVHPFLGKNVMSVCSIDDSFSLFDMQNRINSQPKFLCKYKTITTPIQLQIIDETIAVVCESPTLSFYQLKA